MGKTWVRGTGRHARSNSDSSDLAGLGQRGRDRVDSAGDSSSAAPSPRAAAHRPVVESEAEDAIVITMTSGARYELRSKHAAPSTLGKVSDFIYRYIFVRILLTI